MKPYIFVLLLITILLLFFHLGARPLLSSGEARASEIAVEMLYRGNILVPYLNEEILLTKPVLFHWFIILSYRLFGVDEFAARVPSAIAGILVVLLVYLLGKEFWGPKSGFISGLILVTSPLFFWAARCARIDAVLLLFIVLSLYCFWQGYKRLPQGRMWLAGWFFFMGLGFLSKGPVGVAVSLLTVFLFLIFVRKGRILKQLNWRWGILVFLIVVLPWYIAIYFLVPLYKSRLFFLQQNIIWFSGSGEWYRFLAYIPHLFVGFFPWSLFLPLVLIYTWRDFKLRQDERVVFLWIWFLVVFVIFSFLGKKVSRYILPLYPAISLLVAGVWVKDGFRRTVSVALGSIVIIWGLVLLAVNQFGLAVRFWPGEVDPLFISILEKHLKFRLVEINIAGGLLILLGLIAMLKAARRITPTPKHQFVVWGFSLISLVIIVAGSLIMFIIHGIPVEEEYYSPRPFCNMMKKAAPAGVPLCAYKSWDNTIRFYFGRHIDIIRSEEELRRFLDNQRRVYCFMWEEVYKELPEEIKQQVKIVTEEYKVLEHEVVLVSNI